VTNTESLRQIGALLLALVGAQAVHWFITPMRHPEASALPTGLVAVQALVGLGGAAWLLRTRHWANSGAPAS